MKVLVTGFKGFLGNAFSKLLLQHGHEVVGYDLPEDIRDREKVSASVNGCDCVFHFAAVADLNYARLHPYETLDINVRGTLNVAEACSIHNVPLNFISTACVYGNNSVWVCDELSPTCPTEVYAYSKLAAEQVVKAYHDTKALNYNIIRTTTVYGSNMRKELVIYIFLKNALDNKLLLIHGSGKQTRMFIYIDDLLDFLLRCVDKSLNLTFNVAGLEEVSVRQLATKCCRVACSNSSIRHVEDRHGQIFHELLSIKSAYELLGWYPKMSLDRGLEATYQWICQQK